jgi:hypothetical protein
VILCDKNAVLKDELYKSRELMMFVFEGKNLYLLTESDGDLRDGRSINGPFDAFHPAIKYSRDAIGLGENGAVADAQTQPQTYPHDGTGLHGRLGEDDEGHGVAAEDAAQEDVAEFAAGSHDNWRAVVADEDAGGENCAEDAERGENERDQRPRTQPLDHQSLQLVALGLVLVGGVSWQARFATVVEDVSVLPAGNAHPAALILQSTIKRQNGPEIQPTPNLLDSSLCGLMDMFRCKLTWVFHRSPSTVSGLSSDPV